MRHVPICAAGALLVAGMAGVAQQDTRNQDTQQNSQQNTNTQDTQQRRTTERSPYQENDRRSGESDMRMLGALAGDWYVTFRVNEGPINQDRNLDQNPDRNLNRNQDRIDTSASMSQPPVVMTGFATRSWELGGRVLNERIYLGPQSGYRSDNFSSSSYSAEATSNQPLMGTGLYSYDERAGELNHAWCDTKGEGIILSIGQTQPGARTITFREHYGDDQPNRSSGVRQDGVNQRDAGINQRDASIESQGTRAQDPQRPQPQSRSSQSEPTVTLRIESDDRHTIEKISRDPSGQMMSYTITFDRVIPIALMWETGVFGDMNRNDGAARNRTQPNAGEQQRIENTIARALREAGCTVEQSAESARSVAAAILREHRQGDLSDLEGTLRDAIAECNDDDVQVRSQTAALTREIQQMLQSVPMQTDRDPARQTDRNQRNVPVSAKQQIETVILDELAAIGTNRQTAADSVSNLADSIVNEYRQGDLDNLHEALETLFRDLNVDEQTARTKAVTLTRQINEILGGG